jgi:hypothetical protein
MREKAVAHMILALSLQNERSIVGPDFIKEMGLESIYAEAQRQSQSKNRHRIAPSK